MQWMKTKSLAALGGATLGIVGSVGLSAVAGASGINTGSDGSASPAVAPATASLGAGTYEFVIDGTASGDITLSSDDSFASTVDSNDAGNWVQNGKSIALNITGGSDQLGGCVFAGKVSSTSTASGRWACPANGTAGTWAIASEEAPVSPSGQAVFRAATTGPFSFATGSYIFFVEGGKLGKIKFVAGDTWTSTVDGSDSGSWVPSGKALAFSITAAPTYPNDVGCLFVGTDTATGLNSAAKPAPYVCSGNGVTGTWWAKKK